MCRLAVHVFVDKFLEHPAVVEREETKKGKRKEHWTGILGFRLYNRGIGKLICPYRKLHHRRMFQKLIHTHMHR